MRVLQRRRVAAVAAALLATATTGCDDDVPAEVRDSTATGTGADEHLVSTYGREASVCTAPTGADAVFGDTLRTRGSSTFTLKKVTLRHAENMSVVDARAVPIVAGGASRSPVGTDRWPLTDEGQWWWDKAATVDGPHRGDIFLMVHVTRADPEKPALAGGLQITYDPGTGSPRTLDNDETVRIDNPCPSSTAE